jgi:hypothetical protein
MMMMMSVELSLERESARKTEVQGKKSFPSDTSFTTNPSCLRVGEGQSLSKAVTNLLSYATFPLRGIAINRFSTSLMALPISFYVFQRLFSLLRFR